MPIAAVPQYLGEDFREASPGLRFGMYLRAYGPDFGIVKDQKVAAVRDATPLGKNDQATMKALAIRQRMAFSLSGPEPARLAIDAQATAPFATGLGNEHPLENGFAFLNPYGLPYLPGSGVKGVLRQAARELASSEWGDAALTAPDIAALFGAEAGVAEDHLRGALVFWDVIPQLPGDRLAVDIMTPHQTHYYQRQRDRKAGDSDSPHDSGQPNPIHFLTVPQGARFSFYLQCDLALLQRRARHLVADQRWKDLLQALFAHAFAWLGFGAKTAVGYGAMAEDLQARALRERERGEAEAKRMALLAQQAREQALQEMPPSERAIQQFLDERPDKNQSEAGALIGSLKAGRWDTDATLKSAVALHVQADMQRSKKWKETSEKKNPEKDRDHQDTLLVMRWLG